MAGYSVFWIPKNVSPAAGVQRDEDRVKALLNDPENIALFHDGEFFAVDLDFRARPFAEQHAVAGLDVERNELPVLVAQAGAGGDDLALHRLLLGGVRNYDTSGSLL